MTADRHAMVIGASGGIGAALVKQLVASGQYTDVYAVTRRAPATLVDGARYVHIQSNDETDVAKFCAQLAAKQLKFSCVVCCTGILHREGNGSKDGDNRPIAPEKRLEDINAKQLLAYFEVNSVIPALWIKHSEPLLKNDKPATFVVLSARVGSISDNNLGGWYGYRASKAALNMLVKTAQIELKRRAPNIGLLCYHPGTIDTDLSRPYQRNVPKEKLFSAEFTAAQLLRLLPGLSPDAAPYYLDWQGQSIDW